MSEHRILTAVGAGLTAFLLVTVAVIEVLGFEFSAMLALPVGIVAGLVVLLVATSGLQRAGTTSRRLAQAAAGFGYTVLLLLAVRYVNVGGIRGRLSVMDVIGAAVGIAIAVFLLSWFRTRPTTSA